MSCVEILLRAAGNILIRQHDFDIIKDIHRILNMLYEAYNEVNLMDDDKVKQDFHELYELMNGMPLREMDQIVYPVCTLCRDHERSGFIHGVQVGIRLAEELK